MVSLSDQNKMKQSVLLIYNEEEIRGLEVEDDAWMGEIVQTNGKEKKVIQGATSQDLYSRKNLGIMKTKMSKGCRGGIIQ